MKKYKKKPVIIEAVQWLGSNYREIQEFAKGSSRDLSREQREKQLVISTLEGDMLANLNDYIIKGIKGELYPCKPDVFEMTYEEIE
jgi:hypothetical protein